MLGIPWFAQHLNYQGFVTDCQGLFGQDKVIAFKYDGDVVQEVIQKLGLATPSDNPTPRQNNSLNNATIALLRTVNQYEMKAKDKELLIPHLKAMNTVFESYQHESLIDEASSVRVLQMCKPVAL
jgi:hypothetical protein